MTTTATRHPLVLRRFLLPLAAAFVLCAWMSIWVSSASAAAPSWTPSISSIGHFSPGAKGNPTDGPAYRIAAENSGDAPTAGQYKIIDILPSRLTPGAGISGEDELGNALSCESSGQTVTCTGTEPVGPDETVEAIIPVDVSAGPAKIVIDQASVEGGGASPISASTHTLISAGQPAWRLTATSQPTNFIPGEAEAGVAGYPLYDVVATNIGAASTSGPFTIVDTLPEGITPVLVSGSSCSIVAQTITCTYAKPLGPSENERLEIRVEVDPLLAEGTALTDHAEVSGGGALPVSVETTATAGSTLPAFGFLAGLSGTSAVLNAANGSPVTQAGSHPYQLTIDLGFPSRRLLGEAGTGGITGIGGGLRDLSNDLPRGFIVDPAATPVRCTEDQLESHECPDASAIGIATVLTTGGGPPQPSESALYNMVAPAGTPAELGFDAAGLGIFAHLKGEVRSDGDYGLSATSNDILSRSINPVLAAQAQLWGDPSDPSHDGARGDCGEANGQPACEVELQEIPFLTLPTECSESLSIGARADSWENPDDVRVGKGPITDATTNPSGVDGCNALQFEPSISSQPTTNLAESPSGLDFNLHQPQSFDLKTLSTAALKDVSIALPEGMTLNPAAADGIEGCDSAQIGLQSAVGETPAHFSKALPNCPSASRLGTLEVTTPALSQYDAEDKVELDPETGEPIPDPVHGSVYLAKPFDNPFDSLLAVYLAVEDEKTGIVVKFPGKISADPNTGQLVTHFAEAPELPLEDVHVRFFGGARAPLITPPLCGAHTTTSTATPWSSPEGGDAHPSDTFLTSAFPGGGGCPTNAGAAPNHPTFSAGTIDPVAGAYSPFVLKLNRNDGSQRLAGVDTTLPPGLIGKLAGLTQCSEAQLAAAKAREVARRGVLEKASPSCPTSSEIGTIDVSAGAGPTPLHVGGHAYISGPYKGAPLSVAIITPAVAGPFDLGAVVVRVALYLDPQSAQIHAVSDPFPQTLQGIPLDVRGAALKFDRPSFTLNPTSCDPMKILGNAATAAGQSAALSNPFQVGGCSGLGFKPKLALKLKGGTKRGGHPAFQALYLPRPGDANIKGLVVRLPRSAFLDQAHIRTVCTRVQFAAEACPPGSQYGSIKAWTPLLDDPLQGPVYLRSSDHKLPDLVFDLRGTIDVEVATHIDSIHGGIRASIESAPDAPLSKVVLDMQGAKKGLIVNSRNLCKGVNRADVQLEAQNGKADDFKPELKSSCGKQGRKGHGKGGHGTR